MCSLPATKPVWIDYAGHHAPIPAKPGMVLAVSSGIEVPRAMRAAGAHTVFFDLNFNKRVGTTSAPADPSTIPDKANRLYDYAVGITGCSNPVVALNELFGAQTTTPWSTSNAQYRANVLALVRGLAARGAQPALTIANPPFTGGEAAEWWRQAAEVALLIRQVYFKAPQVHAQGPILGSRTMRERMRQTVIKLTSIGVPINRIAIELQFQSAPGQGGREGLQPSSAWYEVIKLQALAAKEIARELGIPSIWSWGWATFSQAGLDADKPAAACVYLWARSPALCDAPALAGPTFDTSLTAGQIALPAGVRCTFRVGQLTRQAIFSAAAITGDSEVAATAMLERIFQVPAAKLEPGEVLRAERAVIDTRFDGNAGAYRRALSDAGATPALARIVLANQLRRASIETRLRATRPTDREIEAFYRNFGSVEARSIEASPAPVWLGGVTSGLAIRSLAPPAALTAPTGKSTTVRTIGGPVTVKPLGPPVQLGSFPLASARPAIAAALSGFAAQSAYEAWLVRKQRAALPTATCLRDRFPALGSVDLAAYLPFLAWR